VARDAAGRGVDGAFVDGGVSPAEIGSAAALRLIEDRHFPAVFDVAP